MYAQAACRTHLGSGQKRVFSNLFATPCVCRYFQVAVACTSENTLEMGHDVDKAPVSTAPLTGPRPAQGLCFTERPEQQHGNFEKMEQNS